MTTNRWRRVDTLYHEIMARPLDERAAALSGAWAAPRCLRGAGIFR